LRRERRLVRLAAAAGIAGPPLFVVGILGLTGLEYDFLRGLGWHPVANSPVPWPSALALGPYGWVQVANFVVFGLLLAGFALGLRRALVPGRGASAGPALLVVAGVALVLCGAKTDPDISRPPRTMHGWVHAAAFVALLVFLLLAFFAFWRALRREPAWRTCGAYSLVAGLTALSLVLTSLLVPGPLTFYGLLAVAALWLEALALRLWRLTGPATGEAGSAE
jgi:Protein of unknown function (DUF998)